MREKWLLEKRETEGKTFFFLKIGSCRHDKPSFIVWVSPKLVTQNQDGLFLELPAENVELTKGKKDLVLRPGSKNLFNVFVKCGYRGESEIEILTPSSVFEYQVWSSPQGSLGISRGSLSLPVALLLSIVGEEPGEHTAPLQKAFLLSPWTVIR